LMFTKTSPLFLDLSSYLTRRQQEREFREFFGIPSFVCELLWQWCSPHTPHKWFWSPDKLFGCLYFLKENPSAGTISSLFDCDWWTFEKDLWNSLHVIDFTLPNICLFCQTLQFSKHNLYKTYFLFSSLTSVNIFQTGHSNVLL
jgi:hypothetical protein